MLRGEFRKWLCLLLCVQDSFPNIEMGEWVAKENVSLESQRLRDENRIPLISPFHGLRFWGNDTWNCSLRQLRLFCILSLSYWICFTQFLAALVWRQAIHTRSVWEVPFTPDFLCARALLFNSTTAAHEDIDEEHSYAFVLFLAFIFVSVFSPKNQMYSISCASVWLHCFLMTVRVQSGYSQGCSQGW